MIVECWHNGEVPENPIELSKFLGFSLEEIKNFLSPYVLSFFLKDDKSLQHKEVNSEKKKILIRRLKQSEGGKAGQEAKKRKMNKSQNQNQLQGEPDGQLKGLPKGSPEGSLNQIKSDSIKSIHVNQEMGILDEHTEWKRIAFEDMSDNSYLKASRG
jgi:uncharacterized protein YdaU (DUF1376 family)